MKIGMDRRVPIFRKRGAVFPWIVLLVSLLMAACSPGNSAMGGSERQPSGASTVEAQGAPPPSPSPSWPAHLKRSPIAKQPPQYIPLAEAGGYDRNYEGTVSSTLDRLCETEWCGVPIDRGGDRHP